MGVEPVSALSTGVFVAVVGGLYGLFLTLVWSPFLLARRVRGLFEALPPSDWQLSYVAWMPLPSACWGFLWGSTLSVRADLQPPEATIGAAAMDGVVLATVVSLLLWPALLLYVLPARGVDWDPAGFDLATGLLVGGGTLWYFVFIVVPMYLATILAGIGGAMTGT